MQELTSTERTQSPLLERFLAVRLASERICEPLEVEDHVIQPAPFVSPPKWHLAHTSWFFESFVLENSGPSIDDPDGRKNGLNGLLFNSYYKSVGEHWLQAHRGHLSRPTVQQILDYRHAVTEAVERALVHQSLSSRQLGLLELGIHHEQQHQELLFMDIKYILGMQPSAPAYDAVSCANSLSVPQTEPLWLELAPGIVEIGQPLTSHDRGFGFDNERPAHRQWLQEAGLRSQLVRNDEFLQFMDDGGYRRPELWLSDGWDWVMANDIQAPLYWRRENSDGLRGGWLEYQLGGLAPLDPGMPVSHISYYEADAFARWAGMRLPTEAELEVAVTRAEKHHEGAFWREGAAVCPCPDRAVDALENGLLWQWCSSAYAPYPGFEPEPGAVGEYNGKFMSGQQVLRGGCVATPAGHWRPTYRNFYRPADRWCFSGIRLARKTGNNP